MENLTLTELAKHLNPLLDTLRPWRPKSKAEVDFVLERQGRRMALEVKAGDARGKVSRSARSFIEAYHPDRFLIVHGGDRESASVEASRVDFVRLEELGAAVRDFLG